MTRFALERIGSSFQEVFSTIDFIRYSEINRRENKASPLRFVTLAQISFLAYHLSYR